MAREPAPRHRFCPWWLGYVLALPTRRLVQNPIAILAPFVSEGMTVLEPGPGMGFFTLDLARLVGPRGRVIAVDLQRQMLDRLLRRARRAGLDSRIEPRLTDGASLGIGDLAGAIDFILAFAVIHELPDAARFFAESYAGLKAGGRALVAEPAGHVSASDFAATLAQAERAGFSVGPGPRIWHSRSAILQKGRPG
jgi:ubiquinone/menaquinone biosynthesis C-methylase UbiE